MKRGRKLRAFGKNIMWKKRVRGSNCHMFYNIKGRKMKGRLSSGEKGKGTKILGKKIKILKNGGGEEYQFVWHLIHP